MFSLVLSVMVISSNGGLLAERTPAAGMLIGAVDVGANYDNMTVAELMAERSRLADSMPSVGLGIALLASGGGVFVVGFGVFWAVSILVGVIMMVAAVPLLIIGPILLAGAARERRAIQSQVRLVDQRIAALRREESNPQFVPVDLPPQNNPNEVPPPPPVRPPGSEFAPDVPAEFLLASF
jgi:hypothetical protein